jgi:hypothetical protein
MNANSKVERARLDIVAAARSMMGGTLSFIEGARRIIGRQADAEIAHDDVDMVSFVVIASDTDAYPFGETRLLWAPDALARLQPEIDRSEQWAREVGEEHCRSLIKRFGPGSDGAPRNEAEFWLRLAWRINAELRRSHDNSMRFLWLDDLVPDTLLPQLETGKVLAWVFVSEDNGKSFVEYRLCLHLGSPAAESYRNAEWSRLLPQPDVTGWLALDRASKEIDVICH